MILTSNLAFGSWDEAFADESFRLKDKHRAGIMGRATDGQGDHGGRRTGLDSRAVGF
jgi:hypothetical protein